MSGLSENGFVPKRTPELKLELEQKLLDVFGSVNLHPQSVFGQMVGLTVEQQSEIWARLEEVYWSQYPRSASGINLDRMVSINGLSRLAAVPSSVRGVVTGVPGTVLYAGRLAGSSKLNMQFELLDDTTLATAASVGAKIRVQTVANNTNYTVTIGSTPRTYNSGVAATEASILTGISNLFAATSISSVLTISESGSFVELSHDTASTVAVGGNLQIFEVSNYAAFVATVDGPNAIPVGTLDQIVTPVSGWSKVSNRQSGTTGRLIETDTELRIRREKSLKLASTGTLDAIVSHMQQVPGVLEQKVLVNATNTTDANGVPAHHIWAIVDGGTSADIADVLFAQVAAGIGYHGSLHVNHVSEVTGDVYVVSFDRPTDVQFYVAVTVKGSEHTPANAVDLIRKRLVEWAQELKIGEPVLWSRLFTPINEVIGEGAYVQELFINTVAIEDSGDELTANLAADANERYRLSSSGVQVFVV